MSKNTASVVIGWVEITEPTSGLSYFPYATGLIQAYVQAHAAQAERYQFLLPEFLRSPIDEIVQRLSGANIVGFSVYIWNINYSLAIAQALKKRSPETLIVFGGPQVPDQAELFLKNLPFIDLVCHGEGEASCLRLLELYPSRDWSGLPGISYLTPTGVYLTQPQAQRISDIDSIPSPYLSGIFEPLMAAYPEIAWAAIWETNRGCPFSCTFCDWGSNTASKVKRFGEPRLQAEIDWFAHQKIDFLFCIDANYGIFPRDLKLTGDLVAIHRATGYPKRIITQMTKNQSERAFEAHKILSDAGMLVAATLSLQSVTPAVLTAIKRDNISLSVYQELLQRFVTNGIPAYTDILLGLPAETYDSFLAGLDTVITQGQHHELRIWNVQLLPNSEMSAPAYRQAYGIESVIVPCHSPADAAFSYQIQEQSEIVIATQSMPRPDWLRAQALAWLTELLYYHRLLQLPLLVIHELSDLRHQDLLAAFLEADLPANTPLLEFIREFLLSKAQAYRSGGGEYCETRDPLSGEKKWLMPAAFVLAQLLIHQHLSAFYGECQAVFEALFAKHGTELPPRLLTEALGLSQRFFEADSPTSSAGTELNYNLAECYAQICKGQAMRLTYQGRPYRQQSQQATEIREK